ncbi:MAG: ABC transporter ATP-binding protein [Clostridiales bacterium]|nr:ABC transporter ATP-binding protein [Clostridiales bacterium]
MLELKNVGISYGKREILKDVSFSIKKKQVTALLGKNGSGKSSLISAINLMIPYRGKIQLLGRDIKEYTSRERASLVGILHQNTPAPHVTAGRLIEYGRSPYLSLSGKFSERDREAISQAIELTDTRDLLNRFVDTLSGGERQKVFLAMVISQNTPLVILDEPTTYMDAEHERSFLRLIQRLSNDKTVLVVMHDLTNAAEIADNAVIFHNNTVAYSGNVEECITTGTIEDIFAVTRRDVKRAGKTHHIFTSF